MKYKYLTKIQDGITENLFVYKSMYYRFVLAYYMQS